MNLLLDTHILLWWAAGDSRLQPRCRAILLDPANEVYFSSVSIWEIAIKRAKGLLAVPPALLREESVRAGLLELAFTSGHAVRVAELPHHHSDPFDRALIAQALSESLTLVSQDEKVRRYAVPLEP